VRGSQEYDGEPEKMMLRRFIPSDAEILERKLEYMKRTGIFSILILVGGLLSGCIQQPPEQPPVGSDVVVQFRRDALGSATANAVPPTTSSINGAAVCLYGKLIKVNNDWVVLTRSGGGGREYWIPQETILLIEVTRQSGQ
jgi:hypothetical protein